MNAKKSLIALILIGATFAWMLLSDGRRHEGYTGGVEESVAVNVAEKQRPIAASGSTQAQIVEMVYADAGVSEQGEVATGVDPRAHGFLVTQDGKIVLDGDRPPPGAPVTGPPGTEDTAQLPY